ncbi:hypothetical protein GFY24_06495 [Nocardia sp. SYP-A9097]|uniref:hypothetical protein n=1 Tax=Nocardia sp. SYP-A9097 TaxID=2663237 RepID=UPI00129AE6F4|nr:hypothetical protein [Nocardia sp. SYP-A9097]MRH87116.1 hypothetical protein [Nocardia sp. SYP-A9097]
MIDPASAVLPVGIWLTLRIASRLGGGTDLDYRRRETCAAYAHSTRQAHGLAHIGRRLHPVETSGDRGIVVERDQV